MVTGRCCLSCAHCLNQSGDALEPELGLDEAMPVLDEVARWNGSAGTDLLLAGGEPLCRPDLPALIGEMARRRLTRPRITSRTPWRRLGSSRAPIRLPTATAALETRLCEARTRFQRCLWRGLLPVRCSRLLI
ncbi:MAG: 4Fe-4S cluster-binding domain-containing protein [Polyangiaceae bacterium]|nr:4Fe-4S cluster-binding domain-containing protein [Polyangiaceae bacterium]